MSDEPTDEVPDEDISDEALALIAEVFERAHLVVADDTDAA